MAPSSRQCITDTTIWIDLRAAGLLEAAFALPHKWLAPDLIIAELLYPPGEQLVARGLVSCELSGEQLLQVLRFRSVYHAPSTPDLAALVLARSVAAILVTGDAHLRRAAEREGVLVHGALWVLEEMIGAGLINGQSAAAAVERIRAAGGRLPEEECRARLARWRGGT